MIVPSTPAIVDGVDLDAVVDAVRGCSAVDDVDSGPAGSASTYLPGREIGGLRLDTDRILVQVRAVWGVPVSELAHQVRSAVAPLVGAWRPVDVSVSDVVVPARYRPDVDESPIGPPSVGEVARSGAGEAAGGTVGQWTSTNAGESVGSSSARSIPTAEATTPIS